MSDNLTDRGYMHVFICILSNHTIYCSFHVKHPQIFINTTLLLPSGLPSRTAGLFIGFLKLTDFLFLSSARRLSNVNWQQKIKNTDIMKRRGTSTNIVQRIIERKLNFFGHICRMQDARLLK